MVKQEPPVPFGNKTNNKNNRKRKNQDEEILRRVKVEKPNNGLDKDVDDTAAFADQLDPAAKHKCVVAIDFGTVGCAYAWGFTRPGQNLDSRSDVYMNRPWPHTTGGKTTTAVLFHKGAFSAVGHAAVEKLANVKTKDRNQYLFLQRFKMQLYSKETINESTMLEDETTKEKISALEVIAACLREIKKCALEEIRGGGNNVNDDDILWVVTVPAIWREDAKQLMRLAAIFAGLTKPHRNTSLLLVLEPEAASIFCLTEDKSEFKTGDVYIVADCGGGTVDVTVHEVTSSSETEVKEAIAVSGGHWGSTVIDKAFFSLLELICGSETLVNLRQKHASRWFQLSEEWERKKCAWDGSDGSDVLLMLPTVLAMEVENGIEAFNNSEAGKDIGEVELDGERLVLSNQVMNYLSKEAIAKTVNHLDTILAKVPKVSKILLVGNFANSIALQKAFRSQFEPKQVKVMVPKIPGEVVARGAVILGNRPRNIAERRAAYSYGYATSVPFIEGVHPPIKKLVANGKTYCVDKMQWLIKYGEAVPFGKTVSSVGCPVHKFQSRITFTVYEGQREGIDYSDDKDCRKLGYVDSAYCDPDMLTAGVKFSMLFGNSELFVTTKDPLGIVTSATMVYK
ncbi:hypothetical protein HDU76_002253 [Blyttiomyces sp. JEL0837]|nr:hypothetical protein HDU76_002253 [Blyttiomyces sp. JEL0837]